MTEAAQNIARDTAARLAATMDPDLPAQVERELTSDPLAPPERVADPISLASLVVSLASLAWTIWHDLKKDHADGSPAEQSEMLVSALAQAAPPALPLAQRVLLIQTLAEETTRIAGLIDKSV